MKHILSLSLLVVSAGALAACGDDTSSSPTPSTSATSKPAATTDAGSSPSASQSPSSVASTSPSASAGAPVLPGFVLESSKFADGAALPAAYTCEGHPFGDGYSPELSWSGAPTTAKSYALVFRDKTLVDAGDPVHGYHWGAWNIPLSVEGIPEHLSAGQFPSELKGGEQFRAGPPHDNEFFGPCPSWQNFCFGADLSNDSYEFVLLAFSEETLTPPAAPEPGPTVNYVADLYAFFESAAIGKTVLRATSNAAPSEFPFCPEPATTADAAAPVSTVDAGPAPSLSVSSTPADAAVSVDASE